MIGMTLHRFLVQASRLRHLSDSFALANALVGIGTADHICYKCGSRQSFESMRAMFEGLGCTIYQSIVSKRYTAYIKLKAPITTALGDVWWVELSDQKPDSSQRDGFDHIEVYPSVGTYEQMVRHLQDRGAQLTKVERPHHTTHDIELPHGFIFRCSQGPLLAKIKEDEFV